MVLILMISGNSINLEGWKSISKVLIINSILEIIFLDFNNLGDEEVVVLVDGIRGCKSFSYIDMEGNKIGDEGVLKFFEVVKVNKLVVDFMFLLMN